MHKSGLAQMCDLLTGRNAAICMLRLLLGLKSYLQTFMCDT